MSLTASLRFVEVHKPGQQRKPEDAWELRSHVRKAIFREKKKRPFLDKLKFIDQTERTRQRRTRKRSDQNTEGTAKPTHRTQQIAVTCRNNGVDEVSPARFKQGQEGKLKPQLTSCNSESYQQLPLLQATYLAHPFSSFVLNHVNLPESRLDHLFKSDALQIAAEPSFDASHVDSTMNMSAVFPGCTNEPVFLHALLYAVVRAADRGRTTVESLHLRTKTIELLNERLDLTTQQLNQSVIGAIMLLKTVAYKWGDCSALEVHSRGLKKCLQALKARGDTLTDLAERAVFWLDVFANLLGSAPRELSHQILSQDVVWQRNIEPTFSPPLNLPIGFLRYHSLIPNEILDCIADILELQSHLAHGQFNQEEKHNKIDTMQASIESRLSFHQTSCRAFGPVAEAVRLGVFITCYQSWTETWESALMPCKIAAQLVEILHNDLCQMPLQLPYGSSTPRMAQEEISEWLSCRDLQLWLLLVGASMAELDRGHVDGLRSKYSEVLKGFQNLVNQTLPTFVSARSVVKGSDSQPFDWQHTLDVALHDFMYCDGWLERRLCIPEWFALETLIDNENHNPMEEYALDVVGCSMFDTAEE